MNGIMESWDQGKKETHDATFALLLDTYSYEEQNQLKSYLEKNENTLIKIMEKNSRLTTIRDIIRLFIPNLNLENLSPEDVKRFINLNSRDFQILSELLLCTSKNGENTLTLVLSNEKYKAVRRGWMGLVLLVLNTSKKNKKTAFLNMKNENGQTALDIATENGDVVIIKMIQDALSWLSLFMPVYFKK